MTISVDLVLNRISDEKISNADALIGCSQDEIDEIRRDQTVSTLPAGYVRFLSRAGRSAGPVLRGTDAFFPAILGIKSDARMLLQDSDLLDERFETESVVIAMHQGYQVFWLPSVTVLEPPVLMYQEGDKGIAAHWDSFAGFLNSMVDEHAYR
jgi:hypothetical protein